MAATIHALGFPADYVDYLPRTSARDRAGREVRAGGWWFPGGGWVRPAELVAAELAAARERGGLTLHASRAVHALDRRGEHWRALSADGAVIATAPVAVLANAHDAERLVPLRAPLKRVRGQLTCLPAGNIGALRVVLAGAGHLVPAGDGAAVVGATYDFEDEEATPSEAGHAGNLERLERLLPGTAAGYVPAQLTGSVGFRCVAADRLPLIGALPDTGATRAGPAVLAGGNTRSLPRLPGLYGVFGYASRGLTWASLGGELVASAVEGEPLPLEGDLADAIDPARFLLRRARRGGR